jgi:hypothetical protein
VCSGVLRVCLYIKFVQYGISINMVVVCVCGGLSVLSAVLRAEWYSVVKC